MITKREQDVICMLEDFHIATTNQIFMLFFKNTSLRYCQTRLSYLKKENVIKKTRSTIDNCNAYYITNKKPIQVHHDLLRAELYAKISCKYTVLEWFNEYSIENIRPDAFAYIKDNGIVFPIFIEVHLSNKFNFEKYSELLKICDLKSMFGIIPRVIICTDRQITIPNIKIRFRQVDIDMSGIDSIFK